MPANLTSDPERIETSASPSTDEPVALHSAKDELARGWYNSSFELKRGLWVIETDLDPAVTHGIVVRKRGPHGAGR